MDSDAFKGLTTALLAFIFVIYVGNWFGTAWRIWQGTALGIPQQREEEDEQARQKKDRVDRYTTRNANGGASASGSNV
jgi:hypothetical protein